MEEVFNIVNVIIEYGIWVFFLTDIFIKAVSLGIIRKRLGKKYHTIPDTHYFSSIRKTSIILSGALFLLLLSASIINNTPLHIPFIALIISLSLILGGKFQFGFGFNGTFFYSNAGFMIYKSRLFFPFSSLKLNPWNELEKVVWKKNFPFSRWLAIFNFKEGSHKLNLMTGKYSKEAIDKVLNNKSITSLSKAELNTDVDDSIPDTSINLN